MSGELQQLPDDLVNQVHHNSVPVLRTDPQAYMVNDGTYDRVMIGGLGDGNYGLKVSQSGHDVKTATDSQLVMSSAFNSFKIVSSGTLSVTLPSPTTATTYTATLAHNLGYAPAHLTYIVTGGAWGFSGYYATPYYVFGGTTTLRVEVGARTDTSNYYVDLAVHETNTNSSGIWTFKYFLLRETANN